MYYMKKENLDETLTIIKSIEEKKEQIEKTLSDIPLLSRSDTLVEITRDIIEQHEIFHEEGFSKKIFTPESGESHSITTIINNLVVNIQQNPLKKIIYLRLFLERFHEISEQDKNVIIQSVKDENLEDLKEKMLSLVNVFKLEI